MGIKNMSYKIGDRVGFKYKSDSVDWDLIGVVISLEQGGKHAILDFSANHPGADSRWSTTKAKPENYYLEVIETSKPKIKVTMGKWKLKG